MMALALPWRRLSIDLSMTMMAVMVVVGAGMMTVVMMVAVMAAAAAVLGERALLRTTL